MKNAIMIASNGCITPKDWTVNSNSRVHPLTIHTIVEDWEKAQGK